MKRERKYKNGDNVIDRFANLKMIVVDAHLTLTGWRYQLGFPKKDGTLNKKMNHRLYFENQLEIIGSIHADKEEVK